MAILQSLDVPCINHALVSCVHGKVKIDLWYVESPVYIGTIKLYLFSHRRTQSLGAVSDQCRNTARILSCATSRSAWRHLVARNERAAMTPAPCHRCLMVVTVRVVTMAIDQRDDSDGCHGSRTHVVAMAICETHSCHDDHCTNMSFPW